MDYDFYESDETIENAISIIEFFRNDFNVIKDFLAKLSDSPWDTSYTIKEDISMDDLVMIKKGVTDSIINFYYNYLLKQISEESIPAASAKSIDELVYLFFTEDSYTVKMLKEYIRFIKSRDEDISIDTKKYFDLDIENLREVLMSEQELVELSTIDCKDEEYNKIYRMYANNLHVGIKNYIKCKVNEDDEELLINYLFSLVYAYIKYSDVDLDADENIEIFMNTFSSDVDLVECFNSDASTVSFIMEYINLACTEYVDGYDLRREVKDGSSQELFSILDKYYDDEYEDNLMINDITLESKLETIMSFFKHQNLLQDISIREPFENDCIKQLLDGTYSIYDILVAVGLDGRYEEPYRRAIIRKYVADVYEYLSYKNSVGSLDTYQKLFYSELNAIGLNWDSICVFFEENYSTIMDYWYEYDNESANYKINACIKAIETNSNKKIDKINSFSAYRYLLIALRKIKQLNSVDVMNQILGQLNSGNINLNQFERPEDVYKLICLNVYERLAVCDEIDIEYREMFNVLNNEPDLLHYLLSHKSILLDIIKVFRKSNGSEITYEKECILRNKIKEDSKLKVLKRLNPYNE